jgi:hypothetical protein
LLHTTDIFFIHAMSMSCIVPLRLQIFDEQKPGLNISSALVGQLNTPLRRFCRC